MLALGISLVVCLVFFQTVSIRRKGICAQKEGERVEDGTYAATATHKSVKCVLWMLLFVHPFFFFFPVTFFCVYGRVEQIFWCM